MLIPYRLEENATLLLAARVHEVPRVLPLVQLLWHDRRQVSAATLESRPTLAVRCGNFFFRYRNALFPAVLLAL